MSTNIANARSRGQDEEGQSHSTTSYQSFSETKVPRTRRQSTEEPSDPLALPPPEAVNNNNNSDEARQERNAAVIGTPTTAFRGFSTSIADLFADPQHERVDCCAITCCGILQHDRDRYLLTGVTPPSPFKRLVMHVFVPATMFFAAGMAAMRIQDALVNQIVSTGLLLLMVLYFMTQCAKGRNKRLEIRKDLLYTKYQIQQQHLLSAASSREHYQTLAVLLEHERPYEDGHDGERDYYLGQTRRDMRSAHPCCLLGCYPDDRPKRSGADDDGNVDFANRSSNGNVCACLFDYACPPYCGMYAQLCGMCALAQEARDVETCVLPAPYRRVDYITVEAVLRYYPAIYHRRHNHPPAGGGDGNPALRQGGEQHEASSSSSPALRNPRQSAIRAFLGHPLSLLSYRLLQSLLIFWIVMLAWSYGGSYYWSNFIGLRSDKHRFEIPDFVLLLLTFGQAFALLFICRFFVNRPKASELSMDAIIKFFASGFFLSASLALFWEMMAVAVLNTFVSLLLAISGVDRMDNPPSSLAGVVPLVRGSSYLTSISASPTLLARFYRNFGYDDATASVSRPDYASVFGMDHPVLYTLYILFATFVVAGFIEELCKYFGFRMVEHPDFFSKDELEEASAILQSHRDEEDGDDNDEEASSDPSRARPGRMDFSKQCQFVQGRGAAITLAMVSVAIGFACCENLIYVFLYASKSFQLELGVLIERCIFPVHPILAAIQSIGVCQRELEASRATKLGRIILPAVIFHGTFDFSIIFISFIGRLVGQGVEDGDLRISNTAELLSIVSCIVVMSAALLYLYHESRTQRERLAAIDRQATVDRSSLI